jgi:hypothetical protein
VNSDDFLMNKINLLRVSIERARFRCATPSGSMTWWLADLLGARPGWRRLSTISALPWAVVQLRLWRGD